MLVENLREALADKSTDRVRLALQLGLDSLEAKGECCGCSRDDGFEGKIKEFGFSVAWGKWDEEAKIVPYVEPPPPPPPPKPPEYTAMTSQPAAPWKCAWCFQLVLPDEPHPATQHVRHNAGTSIGAT